MNWLGKIIQNNVSYDDTVLDIGCGIMQATTDVITKSNRKNPFKASNKNIRCKSLLGCDVHEPYLEKSKNYFPVIKMDLSSKTCMSIFLNKSFDVVMALDVIEHLDFDIANYIITEMHRIARKKIIIYTPAIYESNEKNVDNAWDMGENQYQMHRSYIEPEKFREMGFDVTFPDPDRNTLAIKVVK